MCRSLACIVPPVLLQKLAAEASAEERKALLATLRHDRVVRIERTLARLIPGSAAANAAAAAPRPGAGKPKRNIYDQRNAQSDAPGTLVRAEGAAAVKDVAVNEAYDGLGATYDFFWKQFGWDSIDGAGLPLNGLVHYGVKYDNAFWNSRSMVFGDGDGQLFIRFTKSLDVIAHELTHGVTEHTAGLNYSRQSGALNESMSDVFGSMVKQFVKKQTADKADWLIGNDIVGPELAPALRNMLKPGTANKYDNQPMDMLGYVKTASDNGGVHTNSSIPNRAFALAALAIGGNSWEGPGKVWWAALRDPAMKPVTQFKTFANITVRQAGVIFGPTSTQAQAVTTAWQTVKVL
jgi:Zn-dependent metalloprotease